MTNNARDGITSQKILVERLEIFSTSFVSRKSQMNPNTDISGIEAKIPAIMELRLAISDTATTSPDVINIFMIV